MQSLFLRRSENSLIALAIVLLTLWSAWYATTYRELPHGACVMRQPRYILEPDRVTRKAVLSTTFWLDAGRIRLNGCYRNEEEDLSIDRFGSIQTLFHRDGTVVARVRKLAYSQLDSGASHPVPGVLVAEGEEIDLRFWKLAKHAWIVETDDDRAGMCVTGP